MAVDAVGTDSVDNGTQRPEVDFSSCQISPTAATESHHAARLTPAHGSFVFSNSLC